MTTYLLFLVLRPVATYLPRPLLALLAMMAGVVAYTVAAGPRAAVLRNLAIVLPDATTARRRRLAMRTFVHGALGYVELLGLRRLAPNELHRRYPLYGVEHLDAATAQGRGVVLVGAHVGPISVAGQLLGVRGVPTTVIVEVLQPAPLHRLVSELRSHFGLRLVPQGPTVVRQVLLALRQGGVVCLAADRDVAGTGDELPFFGHHTRVTTAPATLARRTGAVLLPCTTHRTGLWRGWARICEPIQVAHTGNVDDDVETATREMLRRFEKAIVAAPDQWIAFSDLWTDETSGPKAELQAGGEKGLDHLR
jgi:KDO2-lipid IV(A) lauroyltransferase